MIDIPPAPLAPGHKVAKERKDCRHVAKVWRSSSHPSMNNLHVGNAICLQAFAQLSGPCVSSSDLGRAGLEQPSSIPPRRSGRIPSKEVKLCAGPGLHPIFWSVSCPRSRRTQGPVPRAASSVVAAVMFIIIILVVVIVVVRCRHHRPIVVIMFIFIVIVISIVIVIIRCHPGSSRLAQRF